MNRQRNRGELQAGADKSRRHRDDRMDTTRGPKRSHRPHPRPVELVPSSPAPRAPLSPAESVAPIPLAAELGERPIVLEHGSAMARAGWAGRPQPDLAVPSLVGRLKATFARQSDDLGAVFVGAEVLRKRRLLEIGRPVEHGAVQDYNQLEALWSHCFSRLLADRDLDALADHRLLLSSRQAASYWEECPRLAEVALETFGFRACHIAMPAVLCLYPGGALTAAVVDSGEGTTQVVPVYEGRCLPHAVTRLNVGGRDLTESLAYGLRPEHNFDPGSLVDLEALRRIKEGLCYVAPSYGRKLDAWVRSKERTKTYVLPGEGQVTMGSARFQCAEALFTPQLLDKVGPGLARATFSSIAKGDRALIKTMFRNIVLAGGNCLFSGFQERMQNDVQALVPGLHVHCRYAVRDPRQMTNAAWLGGSIMASQPDFPERCLTREEAQEVGYHAVHRYF